MKVFQKSKSTGKTNYEWKSVYWSQNIIIVQHQKGDGLLYKAKARYRKQEFRL